MAALVACLAAGTSSSVAAKPHAGPAPLASLKPGAPAANAQRPQDLVLQAQAAGTVLTPIRNEYQEIAALLGTVIRECR